jgi:hypothetical protein
VFVNTSKTKQPNTQLKCPVYYETINNYNGSISAKKPIPFGGRTTLGADATSWAYGLSLLWRPPIEIGKDWSYALSATIP